jgi:hypothetical protein
LIYETNMFVLSMFHDLGRHFSIFTVMTCLYCS